MKTAHKKREATIGTYITVWIVMIVLTMAAAASGKWAAGDFWHKFPLYIAMVKTFLITAFFMNLKYEKGFMRIMIFIALGVIIILGIFLYPDMGYR